MKVASIATLLIAATAVVAQLDKGVPHAAAKKPLCGLLTMGSLGFIAEGGLPRNDYREAYQHPDVYSAVVVLAQWRQVEPERGKFDFSVIDQALAGIASYNALHPSHPLVGKLRLFTAGGTPDWATKLDGAPLTLTEAHGTDTLGHFWAQGYGDAWRELQAALASRYDSNPLLGEVAISSCSSSTAEPFIVMLTPENLPRLHQAGYTDAAMKRCLLGAIDDYSVWKNTPLDYTFNEFRNSDSGKPVADVEFAPAVMDAFRSRYGARAVIANHGLNAELRPAAVRVYQEIAKLGRPIEFQTVSPEVDWPATIAKGMTYRPTEIETWNSKDAGGPAVFTMKDLQVWQSELGCPAH